MKRVIKKGEALAIMAEAVHSDRKSMWWDGGTAVPENEEIGSVCVVSVLGSLDHHGGEGDCYDHIKERAQAAFDSDCDTVVLRIDSPGGVVSGLNETVFALRRMSAQSGKFLIAYVDELAASAAYALSCACDAIALPPSAIAGSIGVISTIYDQTVADEKMGLKFVTLTSGTRKADGHPHVPISDAALSAEQKRVDRLAKQFFRLVAEARPISAKDAESYQAGIFLGAEAVAKGLADEVIGFDALISALNNSSTVNKKSLANTSKGVSLLTQVARLGTTRRGSNMLISLKALIKQTAEAVDAEKDESKKAVLSAALNSYTSAQAGLAAYKKTKHMIEKHETEEGDEDEEEDEDEESEESEESEAKGNETDRKEKKSAKKADSDDDCDDDKDDEDDDAEEASVRKVARAAISRGADSRHALGQLTAVFEKARKFDALNARVAKIEGEARAAQKNALIDEAVAQRRIPRHLAKQLRGKKLDFVKGTLEMHKTAIVNIDEEALNVPDGTPAGDLPKDVMSAIEVAVVASNLGGEAADKRRQSLITAHRERMAKSNGVGSY